MQFLRSNLVLVLSCLVLWQAKPAFGQAWNITGSPVQRYRAVAVSADGSMWYGAGTTGTIYASTNRGLDWSLRASFPLFYPWGDVFFNGLACSADGTRLIAAGYDSPICTSTNSGFTWQTNSVFGGYQDVAITPDGRTMAAVGWQDGFASHICISTNFGNSWNETAESDANYQADLWVSVGLSTDGQKIIVVSSGAVWTSPDAGVTWVTNSMRGLTWVRCSADGLTVLAYEWTGNLFRSTNAGITWTVATNLSPAAPSLACSADGKRMYAGKWTGLAYASNDAGLTWSAMSSPSNSWRSMACTPDGCLVLAGQYQYADGYIYSSQSTPNPSLEISSAQDHLALSWGITSLPFGVQQRDGLAGNWTDLPVEPVLNPSSGNSEANVPMPDGLRFYRLRR